MRMPLGRDAGKSRSSSSVKVTEAMVTCARPDNHTIISCIRFRPPANGGVGGYGVTTRTRSLEFLAVYIGYYLVCFGGKWYR